MHFIGLVGRGNVHSLVEHLYALLQFCKKEDVKNVYLHIFTDGRDSPPKEGIDLITDLEERLRVMNIGEIATITGRYFAMDRDRRWDRTKICYDAMVMGQGNITTS